jgi:hypothetical protein
VSKKKIIILALASCFLLLAVPLSITYRQRHSMSVAPSFTVGDVSIPQHILIATQGSAFKDALVNGIVTYLKPRGAYVDVIDVSALASIRENDWMAIVVIHTWEFGEPQHDAWAFINRLQDKSKLIDVTTSGSGRQMIHGIDVISAASVMRDEPTHLAAVTAKLDALLQKSNSPGTSPLR